MLHNITISNVKFRSVPVEGSTETMDISVTYNNQEHIIIVKVGRYEKRPTFSIAGWYEILGFDTQRLSDFRRAIVTAHLGELILPYSF